MGDIESLNSTSDPNRYAFSDGELAERRLGVLAAIFSESTSAFLRDALDGPTNLAIDLGCGPGFTTHLLAEISDCDRAIGLDVSTAFINSALSDSTEQVSFLVHNVNNIPFPVRAADVIFCRMLLTHLGDPKTLITRWATQLKPGGCMLLEEAECITTENEILITYIKIVESLLANQGNDLYVGRKLATLIDLDELRPVLNRRFTITVPEHEAARLFGLTIKVWKNNEFVKATHQDGQIAELEEQLVSLGKDRDSGRQIEWAMRQLALQHHESAC